MMEEHQQSAACDFKILSFTTKSKNEFIRQYKKYDKSNAKKYYHQILIELKNSIAKDNIETLKKMGTLINYIHDIEKRVTIKDYYNFNNPLQNTNLVILACKYNKLKILEYLFDKNTNILNNLTVGIGRNTILPDDEDDSSHNAFYYAIRSGNIDLLEILIKKWPDNHFTLHLDTLDGVLSQAYEELKLKNVPLSDEIEFFVAGRLIDLRFFTNTPEPDLNIETHLENIQERINIVVQNINLLKTYYSNGDKVDDRFLFITKFIAQNIHILKRQLKLTYDRLPWEEIEFCLVCFVSSYIKYQEINVFYSATLNKSRILYHLENFGNKLFVVVKDLNIDELAKLPKLPNLKRETVIAQIIRNCPQFDELYKDNQQIRDVHSLEKINNYIQLALSADLKQKNEKLIITRALQVIGEYLKNTLESPKLSHITSELLLMTLPINTRNIIINLRNSLSHAHSLLRRIDIEKNTDFKFYSGVQNDIKNIHSVIEDILFNKKIKTIEKLLKRIINSESADELKEVAEIFNNVKLCKLIKESTFIKKIFSNESKMIKHEKLKKLVQELSDKVNDKTNYENELFKKINIIISSIEAQSDKIKTNYLLGLGQLEGLCNNLNEDEMDHNYIRGTKFAANQALQNITSEIESHDLLEIGGLSLKIFQSVKSKINFDSINRILYEILFITDVKTDSIYWIEELKEKLKDESLQGPSKKPSKLGNIAEKNYDKNLSQRLAELKNILSFQLFETFSIYKTDKKMQAVVEMLVLDILSILEISKHNLENNILFLDDNTPLLTGKSLRNHLAHDNELLEVLFSDASISVFLNAKKLIEENITTKKIGKMVINDLSRLKDKYTRDLDIIINKKKMFGALKKGDVEEFKENLKHGADINARNTNLWTTLHFAAKGSNIEMTKYIIDQKSVEVNAKNSDGDGALHIAAAHGKKHMVKFFIKETDLHIDDENLMGRTPLHIAAQKGNKDTVVVLLQNKAHTTIQDKRRLTPLLYAVMNNHVDVANILMQNESKFDINQNLNGYTILHVAAEKGLLKLVNFLLQNEANVNAKNDGNWVPLHAASLNGHLKVVKALILEGADVNAKHLNGCTSLHYAVENGHEPIATTLIKHGANINAADKTYNNTPLHYASKDGYKEIVRVLLEYEANANVVTSEGITPLHFAIKSDHLEIAILLFNKGVDVNARDRNGYTPLHYAAENGNKRSAKLLLENKANIDAKSINNLTPLHVAALNGHTEVIEFLINNKAAIEVHDFKKCTPLHLAAEKGSESVINLLIKHKAKINAKTNEGLTPLHIAAGKGHMDATTFLIKNKAEVNILGNFGITPLYAAIIGGYKDIVGNLLKNGAFVNKDTILGSAPLHIAVETGHKDIVELLVAHGANINDKSEGNSTPLLSAVKHNYREIVQVLIKNGANVNEEDINLLSAAVLAGDKDMVDILIKNGAFVEDSLLHLVAKRGHRQILKILINSGANINAGTDNDLTPLHIAALEGHEEIVELLIENGANVNVKSDDGTTPLHISAYRGHANVVRNLLNHKSSINIKDNKNRTAIELAVAYGQLETVKMFLQYKEVDINVRGNEDFTLLHIASQLSSLDMVKCLLKNGSNINAKNASGSKPIHIAAREGFKDKVEFFLSKGININEPGALNQTILHYAVMKDNLELSQYLINQNADVKIRDDKGVTPLHIAAQFGHKEIINILLTNGAIYNANDNFNRTPLSIAIDKTIINLLISTEKLFVAVKNNNYSDVECYIKKGVPVDVKDADGATPLHYASWKGYDKVVNVLLEYNAKTNIVGNKGVTPLHYAAKFSYLKIVKSLLANRAVYNAPSDSGKTPLEFTTDKDIVNLLQIVNESFKKVQSGNSQVINDLNKIKDIDTVKAIMNACNRENKTLITAALLANFKNIEQLKDISQHEVTTQVKLGLNLLHEGKYQNSLLVFKSAYAKRKEMLGANNPATVEVQNNIAKILYAQGVYQEALNEIEDILAKQKETLGWNYKDTLATRSFNALVLHRQDRNEEAYAIFKEVYHKQSELLGLYHSETLDTLFHMALALDQLGKHDKALKYNKLVFEKRKEMHGVYHSNVIRAQNNIAVVLANQGKFDEASKIYKEVLTKKKLIFGNTHSDTLRTLSSLAKILFMQKKYHEALKAYEEILDIQAKVLGPSHPLTLDSQYDISNLLFEQGKYISALLAFKKCFYQMKALFGPSSLKVKDILAKIEAINLIFKSKGNDPAEVLMHLQTEINIAADNGDIRTIQRLLKDGAGVNDKDIEGRTPLHFAVSSGHIDIVHLLLKSGADVTHVTNKGNTPLHIAASKGYKDILEILLKNVNSKFINLKTAISGATSLHIAAKSGFLDITKILLEKGAIYDIKNNESKTAFDLSKNQNIQDLLKLIEDLFRYAKNGNAEIIRKLKELQSDEFKVVTKARNAQEKTLLQVVLLNKHSDISQDLIEILKKSK